MTENKHADGIGAALLDRNDGLQAVASLWIAMPTTKAPAPIKSGKPDQAAITG
jgi:hypothetical protein